jgi:hypothetical protein
MTKDVCLITERVADLRGSVSSIPIEVVLQIIGYSELSGALRLKNHNKKATLLIKKGNLCWGTLHDPLKRLGQRLIASSTITETQLIDCLRAQSSGQRREKLGEILVTKGILESGLLLKSLEEQVKETFFEILDWTSGTFTFQVMDKLPSNFCELDKQIEKLLLEKAVITDTQGMP